MEYFLAEIGQFLVGVYKGEDNTPSFYSTVLWYSKFLERKINQRIDILR